ncbi:Heat shock protein DnaJ-like [Bradyrhizobium sp. STM 3843]|uniref:J domain-containing protein n=1 Tax=Bradyrhizobium sp. STM 3843 TaxID=551947 RepID=UPI000240379D|nr:J domain-containing protein [Bradyrhizobium sp. STM 3843]CCE07813.1 Heat shock protein DnaJ-like [Bradyrhizobium sp. STM 3843]
MTIESYPLHWPAGWPRSTWAQRKKSRFNGQAFNQIKELQRELRLLGARDVVISSNVPVRQDGLPYADAAKRRYEDPGVAIYFTLKGKPLAMARDRYWTPWENMRSLVLAIEAIRSIERHGGATMMERAFSGFTALPAPKSCWEILGVAPGASAQLIKAQFTAKAKSAHPDVGGSDAAMAELIAARDQALKACAA